MTNEELLKPRYKVIADYPNNVFQVGQVVNFKLTRNGDWIYQWARYDGMYEMGILEFADYPNIFQKLEWWEERSENDLSEIKYAKTIAGNSVRTVLRFELYWNKIVLDGGKVRSIKNWLPASKEEYETQTKLKQNGQKSAQIKEL